MTTIDILKHAKRTIERGWTRDHLAVTAKNLAWGPCGEWIAPNPKLPNDKELLDLAAKWSIMGAIMRAELREQFPKSDAVKFVTQACQEQGFMFIDRFENPPKEYEKANGKRTAEDCYKLLDRAIQLCKGN